MEFVNYFKNKGAGNINFVFVATISRHFEVHSLGATGVEYNCRIETVVEK